MERGRNKSILIPISPLKTLLHLNRDAVARLCIDAENALGKPIQVLPQVIAASFKGERTPDPGEAGLAVSYLEELMYILGRMRDAIQVVDSDDLKILISSEFEGLVKTVLNILDWFDNGKEYEITDEVMELVMGFKVKRIRSQDKGDKVDVIKFFSDYLLKDDAAYIYLRSKRKIPYRLFKFIKEKNIPPSDAVVAVCMEFAGRWVDLEKRGEQMRSKGISDDASWNQLFLDKDKLIEKWKTSLTALTSTN